MRKNIYFRKDEPVPNALRKGAAKGNFCRKNKSEVKYRQVKRGKVKTDKGQVGVFKSTDGGERRGKNFECAARELLKSEGLP